MQKYFVIGFFLFLLNSNYIITQAENRQSIIVFHKVMKIINNPNFRNQDDIYDLISRTVQLKEAFGENIQAIQNDLAMTSANFQDLQKKCFSFSPKVQELSSKIHNLTQSLLDCQYDNSQLNNYHYLQAKLIQKNAQLQYLMQSEIAIQRPHMIFMLQQEEIKMNNYQIMLTDLVQRYNQYTYLTELLQKKLEDNGRNK